MGELGLKVTDVATTGAGVATWVGNGVLEGIGLGLVVGGWVRSPTSDGRKNN